MDKNEPAAQELTMPDAPDEPISSEELLRRAREDYLTPPPRDERAEPPGVAAPHPPAESQTPLGFEADGNHGSAETTPVIDQTAGERPRRVAPAPPTDRSGDAVGTPEGFQPVQSRSSSPSFFSQLLRFRGIILPVLIFGGIFLFNALDDSKSVDRLTVGDCLMEPDELEITSVEARDCDEPHQLEVFATVQDPAADDVAYPGDDEAFFTFFDRCVNRFRGYVGVAFEDSEIYVSAIYPTADSWRDGDRSGSCVLYEPDSNGFSITRTGTLRNAGR